MEKQKWFERKFEFNFGLEARSSIKENLSSTSIKLTDSLENIPNKVLEYKDGKSWSIKEHIGHLIDLEPLWQGRIEDVIQGREYLRSTDLNNTKTDKAKHNQSSVDDLLNRFLAVRAKTLNMIDSLDDEALLGSALHPRLEQPMRIIDLLYFVSEHDQHHLLDIERLKE